VTAPMNEQEREMLRQALAQLCRTSTTLSARDNHLGRFSGR
jgi:hypothetical protein